MILEISRGYIRVRIGRLTATVKGEMFFPGKEKMGFVLYRGSIRFWDLPDQEKTIACDEVDEIVSDIQAEFSKGGHTLVIEE